MVTNKEYEIPKFRNIEEEEKFWRAHSPLLEGHKGKIQKKEQNRESFLSIRLTGKEIAQLRMQATMAGLAPSTFVRQLLIRKLTSEGDDLKRADQAPSLNQFNINANAILEQKEIDLQYKIYNSYVKLHEEIAHHLAELSSYIKRIEKNKEESQGKKVQT